MNRTFGDALAALKQGKKARLEKWKPGMFLLLAEGKSAEERTGAFPWEDAIVPGKRFILLKLPEHDRFVLWGYSQEEILSEDWEVLD